MVLSRVNRPQLQHSHRFESYHLHTTTWTAVRNCMYRSFTLLQRRRNSSAIVLACEKRATLQHHCVGVNRLTAYQPRRIKRIRLDAIKMPPRKEYSYWMPGYRRRWTTSSSIIYKCDAAIKLPEVTACAGVRGTCKCRQCGLLASLRSCFFEQVSDENAGYYAIPSNWLHSIRLCVVGGMDLLLFWIITFIDKHEPCCIVIDQQICLLGS